jgi:hypothetical protein
VRGVPLKHCFAQWASGKDAEPKRVSMRPGARAEAQRSAGPAAGFKVAKVRTSAARCARAAM